MSTATTIEAQRQQLFRALAVLHAIRLSLTSVTEGFDPDECGIALQVVYDLIDDAAGVLEELGGNDSDAARRARADAASVEQGLRRDAGLLRVQHPELQTVHARMLQAADCVKQLTDLLVSTVSD